MISQEDIIYTQDTYKIPFNPDLIMGRPMTIIDFVNLLDNDCWMFCTCDSHDSDDFNFRYNYYKITMDTSLTTKEKIKLGFDEKIKLRKLINNKQEILLAKYDFMVIYIGEKDKYRVFADRQPDGSYYFQAFGAVAEP